MRRELDYAMASLLSAAREITAPELTPLRVELPYGEGDGDYGAHRRLLGCDLEFDQSQFRMVFRHRDMAWPVHTADSDLENYLEAYAEQVVETVAHQEDLLEKVERAIWATIKEGRPTLENVAAALYMSPRTLQRRLSEKGLKFIDVVDDFRHELATSLLADDELAIYEIAFLLGYSEPSTFHRAFRRWTDTSPKAFRASAMAAQSG
jgi:AraC-like DNA-binding protein